MALHCHVTMPLASKGLRGLHLLVFLSGLIVSVLGLQLPGALVSALVVVSPNFLQDFLQIRLFAVKRQ